MPIWTPLHSEGLSWHKVCRIIGISKASAHRSMARALPKTADARTQGRIGFHPGKVRSSPAVLFWSIRVFGKSYRGTCPRSRDVGDGAREKERLLEYSVLDLVHEADKKDRQSDVQKRCYQLGKREPKRLHGKSRVLCHDRTGRTHTLVPVTLTISRRRKSMECSAYLFS